MIQQFESVSLRVFLREMSRVDVAGGRNNDPPTVNRGNSDDLRNQRRVMRPFLDNSPSHTISPSIALQATLIVENDINLRNDHPGYCRVTKKPWNKHSKRQSYTIAGQEGGALRESYQVWEACPSSACREASCPVSGAYPWRAYPSAAYPAAYPSAAYREASCPVWEACPSERRHGFPSRARWQSLRMTVSKMHHPDPS